MNESKSHYSKYWYATELQEEKEAGSELSLWASARKRAANDSEVTAPPLLIGGVNCQRPETRAGENGFVGLHNIQGTISYEQQYEMLDYLTKLFGREPVQKEYGTMRYDRHYVFEPFSARLYVDSSADRCKRVHNGRITLSLHGSCLDQFTSEGLFRIVHDLVKRFGFLATRLDVFWDDYERIIEPHQVFEEACRNNISGFKIWSTDGEYSFTDELKRHGSTANFGRRGRNGSGKYLRVYDKNLESDGEFDCIRWEVEFSQKRSMLLLFELAESIDIHTMVKKMAAHIGGVVEFVDRQSKCKVAHINRLKRLDWWEKIVGILGKAKLRNPVPNKSIDKAAMWIENSVAVTLGMLKEAIGVDFFDRWLEDVIEKGQISMKSRHKVVVDVYLQQTGMSNRCQSIQADYSS